jgi:hypothetical protein
MSARGALSSKYLVATFATAIAAALGSTVAAQAQVDLNLQSRLSTLSPSFAAQPSIGSAADTAGPLTVLGKSEDGRCKPLSKSELDMLVGLAVSID